MAKKLTGPSVKSAAWLADGTCAVLVENSSKRRIVLLVKKGRMTWHLPAVAKAFRVAALPSGAVVTLSPDGKGKLAKKGSQRAANINARVEDLAVCHGIAYAVGGQRAVFRLDEATATWIEMGLAAAVKPLLPDIGETDEVHSIVEGTHGPIIAMFANSYRTTLVMEWTGSAWRPRGKVHKLRVNAIARSPKDDLVYLCGDAVTALDAKGKAKRIGKVDDDVDELWAAGWSDSGLIASDLCAVFRVNTKTGKLATLLPHGDGEVPRNHSLYTSGPHAAFVRASQLYVLAKHELVHVPL